MVEPPIWKIWTSKWESSPNRGENKKIFETTNFVLSQVAAKVLERRYNILHCRLRQVALANTVSDGLPVFCYSPQLPRESTHLSSEQSIGSHFRSKNATQPRPSTKHRPPCQWKTIWSCHHPNPPNPSPFLQATSSSWKRVPLCRAGTPDPLPVSLHLPKS